MKINSKLITNLIFCGGILIFPALALAHQPEIVQGTPNQNNPIVVTDPEISKAYYGKLSGEPQFFKIDSSKPFNLYVNILVPDIAGQKKDVTAVITKRGNYQVQTLASLSGPDFTWKKFFEPFGHDNYLMGPEYRAKVDAGVYFIQVLSSNEDSKYSLAIGETEKFGFKEGLSAINSIPQIKRNFFNESPINFILSPFGWGYILVLYILALLAFLIYSIAARKMAKEPNRKLKKNIGSPDRWFRAILGAVLLLLAITTSWNGIVIFISALCFYEAIFSWCAIYSALGKNTCPLI